MRRNGVQPKVISGILGHSGIGIAMETYDHTDTREFKQPLEQLLRNVMKTAPGAWIAERNSETNKGLVSAEGIESARKQQLKYLQSTVGYLSSSKFVVDNKLISEISFCGSEINHFDGTEIVDTGKF